MSFLKREQAKAQGASIVSYAPVIQSFASLSEDEQRRLRVKFDIAYFVATELLTFQKYPRICDLEARHGIDLGSSYLR